MSFLLEIVTHNLLHRAIYYYAATAKFIILQINIHKLILRIIYFLVTDVYVCPQKRKKMLQNK